MISGKGTVKDTTTDITLRAAEEKDIGSTFSLATQKHIREVSFSNDIITPESHWEWFLQRLSDSNCLFLIAEAEGTFIGQVRFDIKGSGSVISISLVRHYRGVGAGRRILYEALKLLTSLRPDVRSVNAYIKNSNRISISFFSKLGFKLNDQLKINDIDALEYQFNIKEVK